MYLSSPYSTFLTHPEQPYSTSDNINSMIVEALTKPPFTGNGLVQTVVDATHAVLYGNFPHLAEPILPPEIRYALSYKQARLGPVELLSLINAGCFIDPATYCLAKALDKHPDQQRQFIEGIVDIVTENPFDTHSLKSLQRYYILGPNFTPINSAKLAQISRQGPKLWQEKFTRVAKEVTGDSETVPVYIAYGGIMGLRQGIEVYKAWERRILILIPNWVNNTNHHDVGYQITTAPEKRKRVTFLPREFERPLHFLFIDDVWHNGIQAQAMWDFWFNGAGTPLDKSQIRAIDYVPKSQ